MAIGVMIIESLGPEEFFHSRLDGRALSEVLKVLAISHEYRIGLNLKYFCRSLQIAAAKGPRFLHLSAHGNEDGIGLGDGAFVSWGDLAPVLAKGATASSIAVCLSTCAGATTHKLQMEMAKLKKPFPYLIGSSDINGLSFADSCVGWSIFYKTMLERKELETKARMKAAVDASNK